MNRANLLLPKGGGLCGRLTVSRGSRGAFDITAAGICDPTVLCGARGERADYNLVGQVLACMRWPHVARFPRVVAIVIDTRKRAIIGFTDTCDRQQPDHSSPRTSEVRLTLLRAIGIWQSIAIARMGCRLNGPQAFTKKELSARLPSGVCSSAPVPDVVV